MTFVAQPIRKLFPRDALDLEAIKIRQREFKLSIGFGDFWQLR